MIIGESDQYLSENIYYEAPQKIEILKRKFSNENENVCENLSNFSVDRSEPNNFANKSDDKIHYIDNVTNEHYHTYQATEIHQDGEQSYINLTVLTPTLVHYDDKSQSNHQPQMSDYTNTGLRDDHKSSPVSSSNNKFEVRNYQHHQPGE